MFYRRTEDGEEIEIHIKAGTEELSFYSETGTYNRDDVPCIDFVVSEDLKEEIEKLLEKVQSLISKLNKVEINIEIKDCETCKYRNVSKYVNPCYECNLTDNYSKWEYYKDGD